MGSEQMRQPTHDALLAVGVVAAQAGRQAVVAEADAARRLRGRVRRRQRAKDAVHRRKAQHAVQALGVRAACSGSTREAPCMSRCLPTRAAQREAAKHARLMHTRSALVKACADSRRHHMPQDSQDAVSQMP